MMLIDEIHDESNEMLKKGMPLLNDSLSKWVRRNEPPCNMEDVLRGELINARKKEEH